MPKHQTLERQLNTLIKNMLHDTCLKLRPYRPLLFVVYTKNIQKVPTTNYFGKINLINYHMDVPQINHCTQQHNFNN